MSDIGFALNYTNLYEIQIPALGWERIGAGIQTVDPNGNESIAQDAYYDGEGMSSTAVTGGQQVLSFKGHREYGNPAQDYIASLTLDYGESRKVPFRWTAPDGQVLLSTDSTIANIKAGGGDANSKSAFEFEIHLNGRPTLTPGDSSTFPESITASPLSVNVGGTVAVVATPTPASASKAFAYAVEDTSIATVTSDGIVKGIAAGETKLSIKSMVKPSIAIEVAVTVAG